MRSFYQARGSKKKARDIRFASAGRGRRPESAYERRDSLLKQLNLAVSYAEYLESDLWKFIRTAVFGAAGGKCKLCGSEASEVHHLKYDRNTLTGKPLFLKPPRALRHLVALCRECHVRVEFTPAGIKRDFYAARKRFFQLAQGSDDRQ